MSAVDEPGLVDAADRDRVRSVIRAVAGAWKCSHCIEADNTLFYQIVFPDIVGSPIGAPPATDHTNLQVLSMIVAAHRPYIRDCQLLWDQEKNKLTLTVDVYRTGANALVYPTHTVGEWCDTDPIKHLSERLDQRNQPEVLVTLRKEICAVVSAIYNLYERMPAVELAVTTHPVTKMCTLSFSFLSMISYAALEHISTLACIDRATVRGMGSRLDVRIRTGAPVHYAERKPPAVADSTSGPPVKRHKS